MSVAATVASLCVVLECICVNQIVGLYVQGPLLELSSQRLLFECPAGGSASASLTVHNTGSTALHYRWERLQSDTSAKSSPVLFRSADQHGAILPGALHTFWYVQLQLHSLSNVQCSHNIYGNLTRSICQYCHIVRVRNLVTVS